MTSRAAVAAIVLFVLMGAIGLSHPGPTSAKEGILTFRLTISGEVPSGETHVLFFDPGNAGQTLFAFCGEFARPCATGTVERGFSGLEPGTSFAYRFQRVARDGSVTVYLRGTAVVGEVGLVYAVFTYGAVPDTAVSQPHGATGAGLFPAALVVTGLVAIGVAGRRQRRLSKNPGTL